MTSSIASTTNTMLSSSNNVANPFRTDVDLQRLISKLNKGDIQTARAFRRWRKQFLRYMDPYVAVDEEHDVGSRRKSAAAHDATAKLNTQVEALKDVVDTVRETFLSSGDKNDHSPTATTNAAVASVSVKGRLLLHKLNRLLAQTIRAVDTFVPLTTAEEDDAEYDKLMLVAALLEDGFTPYHKMASAAKSISQDLVNQSSGLFLLEDVADKQLFERMQAFQQSFERFCAVMNDLGVYAMMVQSAKYCCCCDDSTASSDDDEDDDVVLFIDLKTGQIGELFRDECVGEGKLLSFAEGRQRQDGEDGEGNGTSMVLREAAQGAKAQEALLKLLLAKLQLGTASSTNTAADSRLTASNLMLSGKTTTATTKHNDYEGTEVTVADDDSESTSSTVSW